MSQEYNIVKEEWKVPISIIVPGYNVYEWLDECLQSIVDQTFRDFEIILINDGSTDGSEKKCVEWKEKDSRIRYIDKKREGVFIARNIGVEQAKGKYLLFIDSDDWIDQTYVEKLYQKAIETDADIVECDFWRFNNNNKTKTYRPCYGHMEIEYSPIEHMIYGESTLWKYISKKSIWTKYQIVIPNCLGSAHVVYVLFLALGASIVNIHEPLYYYRRLRKGSILDINGKGSTEEGKMGIQQLEVLIDEFKRRKLYDEYKKIIERTIKYRLSDLLAAQFTRKSYQEFQNQCNNYYSFIEQYFPNSTNRKYLVIGGYNLNRILSYLPDIHNPYCRFNFSSIISIMNPVVGVEQYHHKNEYRQRMIERDICSLFWDIAKEIKPSYLFLDFIEERFDVVQLKKEGFITKSDAFDEIDIELPEGRIIDRKSEECRKQWEKDFSNFSEKIKKIIPEENIVLVENYLCEEVGDIHTRKFYENREEIQEVNRQLKYYYQYVKDHYKKVKCIEAYQCKWYFTDKEYEYGAVPSHVNEVTNKEIAGLIEKALLV